MRAKQASDSPQLAHAWDSGGTSDVSISPGGRESSRLKKRGVRIQGAVGSTGSIGGHGTILGAGHEELTLLGELHVSAAWRTRY